MSVIVAVTKQDRTVVASDSLTCFGDSQRIPEDNARTSKARRIGASIVGASGWAVYDCILSDHLGENTPPSLEDERDIFAFFIDLWRAMHDRYTMVNDQAQSKDSPFGDLDSTFLIANRGGIFQVSNDMDVSRFRKYHAIGSGAEYALGAVAVLYDTDLDAASIARRAVEVATTMDIFCGGSVVTLEVE